MKPFSLDEMEWKTVEHYFQAMRFSDPAYRKKISECESIGDVTRLAKAWFKPKRKDWRKIQTTVMTRGLYMQCQMYPEMTEALLETEDRTLVENSQYDYFWGCGRDRRGENHYGKILMNIRARIRSNQED